MKKLINYMANLDLSCLTIWQIKYLMNSFWGDGHYMNTKEYQHLYNQLKNELIRRSTNKH